MKHCRKFRYSEGYCGMLACSRCGKRALAQLRQRIVNAMKRHNSLWFVTIYYYAMGQEEGLPLWAAYSKEKMETVLRQTLNKLLRALRDNARRLGEEFEYVIVVAFGEFHHRYHARPHAHIVCTWLPNPQVARSRRTRYDVDFLEKRLSDLKLYAWVEMVRENDAVARYIASNAESAVGKSEFAKMKVYRFSQGFEK
jgi:hypothetical protein